MYSVIVRLSNPTDEIINTTVHLYGGYSGPSYAGVNLNIEPHRSIKYTIKWNNIFISFNGEERTPSDTIASSTYI
jgi:hypothetical protein